MERPIRAHQIEKSDVLPWVRQSYITHFISPNIHVLILNIDCIAEPRREKSGLRGFRPGPTQAGL